MNRDQCWHVWGPGANDTPYAGKYTYCWQIPTVTDFRHKPELLDPYFGRYAHEEAGRGD